jgi:hypothetical protein
MPAPTYEPDTYYHAKLKRPVKLGLLKLLPSQRHKIKGSVITQIIAEYGGETVYDIVAVTE